MRFSNTNKCKDFIDQLCTYFTCLFVHHEQEVLKTVRLLKDMQKITEEEWKVIHTVVDGATIPIEELKSSRARKIPMMEKQGDKYKINNPESYYADTIYHWEFLNPFINKS